MSLLWMESMQWKLEQELSVNYWKRISIRVRIMSINLAVIFREKIIREPFTPLICGSFSRLLQNVGDRLQENIMIFPDRCVIIGPIL